MTKRRVVCTGLGVVCPLGLGAEKSWLSLLNSKSGIIRLKEKHSFRGCQSRVAAYVPKDSFEAEIAKHSYISKNAKHLSRAASFVMLAAHEALEQSKLLDGSGQLIKKYRHRCGVAVGQGMVDFLNIYDNGQLILNENDKDRRIGFKRMSPFFMIQSLINMPAGNLSIRYKLNGPNHCVSTACASGAHSIGDALNFIRSGQADLMVCGSTEASINSIAVAGFERLKALCVDSAGDPSRASRPFDESRSGFVMGEGAGIMILEEFEHAKNRGIRKDDMICDILGYGTSADGYHHTAPDPGGLGARLSMNMALNDANLEPNRVTHVNAHATSTPIGDDIECNAIESVFFPEDQVDEVRSPLTVTSCKSSIGHLLGAAGSVEAVFAMLSCRDGQQPPCLNLKRPLSTHRNMLKFIREKPAHWTLHNRILVKNSFGFGGTNATLVISNVV